MIQKNKQRGSAGVWKKQEESRNDLQSLQLASAERRALNDEQGGEQKTQC